MHNVRFAGEKLKALRGSRKWDQHKLAEAARSHGVGINQSQISRYENGQEPSGRNALALAAALGVDVRELYGDDPEEEESQTVGDLFTVAVDQMRLAAAAAGRDAALAVLRDAGMVAA